MGKEVIMNAVKNSGLNYEETEWLSVMLSEKFRYKKLFIEQINSAKIDRDYRKYYIFLKFEVKKKEIKIPNNVRVPIEMRVFTKDSAPIQFLLHVLDGYVYELEIFHADSSNMEGNISLENHKVIIDESLAL